MADLKPALSQEFDESSRRNGRGRRLAFLVLAGLACIAPFLARLLSRGRQTSPVGHIAGSFPRPDDYERRDVSLSVIAIIALALLVFLGVSPIIVHFAWPTVGKDVDRQVRIAPPGPRLQTDPPDELAAYTAKEKALLNSYGWIDRAHGIARVPIEAAMKQAAQHGIDGFPQARP